LPWFLHPLLIDFECLSFVLRLSGCVGGGQVDVAVIVVDAGGGLPLLRLDYLQPVARIVLLEECSETSFDLA